MKILTTFSLLALILISALAQAQNITREKNLIKNHHNSRPGLERYLHTIGMNAWAKKNSPISKHSFSGSVDTAWVRHYTSRLTPSEDAVTDMAIDTAGNVYVTGHSQDSDPSFSADYFTIKYNATGVEVWKARYNGSGEGDDFPSAIAVDIAGNVYVTGSSLELGTSDDYVTIKYNTAGAEQWVARYSGPGNSFDKATALAVDAAGNVYVTGNSGTIKYNNAGMQQWIAPYNGQANALAVDNAGNVYVTGLSANDYATVKYNSTGVEQWSARYDGPGNGDDLANAIAIDATSNVYVTGRSLGSGADHDYATIQYNAAGAQQWVARYNGPENSFDEATALAVDAAGNIHVTGNRGTMKYNSAGMQQWIAPYNGQANALAVDNAGNVYVAGSIANDYATAKYNSAGAEQWIVRYDGPEHRDDRATVIAIDAANNVYVTGRSLGSSSDNDYATVKYNSTGAYQWDARYNGLGYGLDQASALAVDAAGNVSVTGWSRNTGVNSDYATVKYNSVGDVEWIERFNGTGNLVDEAKALAVDAVGNVYVTGWSWSGTDYDYATVKYNHTGVEQWVARYNGPKNFDDRPIALALDATGNVYVTGESAGSDMYDDYVTVKYNSAGAEQWIARYNGTGNFVDEAKALVVDATGNVYVTGWSVGSGTNRDYTTIKYNSSGVEQWVARYNGPANHDDRATGLTLDTSGNVYVTGFSWSSAAVAYDYATIKYDSAGMQQWVARYNGPGNSNDETKALAIDAAGNVYVTGSSHGSGTNGDYATVKYDRDGTEQWAARYNGLENDFDTATALAVDATGNVYVTGSSSINCATLKYNSSGVEQWGAHYKTPAYSQTVPAALTIDAAGYVYMTGWNQGANWSTYITIKYTQTTVSVDEKDTEIPSTYSLMQNYPNPFWSEATSRFAGNPETTIEYIIPMQASGKAHVTLNIYNLQGRLVRALVNEEKASGRYRTLWDGRDDQGLQLPSGVYMYRLQTGDFTATKKLAILK